PKDRFQTAAEVIAALATIEEEKRETKLGGPRETTRAAVPAHTERQPARKRRRLAIWLATGVLLVTTLTIVLAMQLLKSGPVAKAKLDAPQPGPGSNADPTPVPATGANTPGTPSKLVTVVSVSSGKPYDVATVGVGVKYWIDRIYHITAISPGLNGGVL